MEETCLAQKVLPQHSIPKGLSTSMSLRGKRTSDIASARRGNEIAPCQPCAQKACVEAVTRTNRVNWSHLHCRNVQAASILMYACTARTALDHDSGNVNCKCGDSSIKITRRGDSAYLGFAWKKNVDVRQ